MDRARPALWESILIQNMDNRGSMGRRARARPVRWILFAVLLAGARGWADAAPSGAMLEPVHELVRFMSTLPAGKHPRVFASRGICIIEDFAPYLFCGPHAASRWEAGFRAHSNEGALSELAAQFETAYDFSQSEDRAYFSLPTTWTGRTQGRAFEEHGAWSFVLLREAGGWRIAGYGWGVTGYTEQSP
jgi:hypothetical protein